MTKLSRDVSAGILYLTLLAVLLNYGCGKKEAQSTGCPSGSFSANASDKIQAPTSDSKTFSFFTGGTVLFSPVEFRVFESDGVTPKSNICLELYTTGFWWPDAKYTANPPILGEGPMNRITAATDVTGKIKLYWSTSSLPASNPSFIDSTGAAQDGLTQTGQDWIHAYSGAAGDAQYSLNWTVSGCPKGVACP